MSTTETVRAWSATAASNNTSDAAITSADTQSPDTLDNNIRSIMAAVRKQMDDIGGKLVAGGTANALTVTTGQVLESGQLVDGLALAIEAASTNTSATVTFAPDGLTAANIKRADGSVLAIGSIKAGMRLLLQYDAGASEWRCANIAPALSALASSPAAVASFSANKNGANQSLPQNTATKITFTTEAYDTGSNYDAPNSKWTPPSGTCLITSAISFDSLADQVVCNIQLWKNGAVYQYGTQVPQSGTTGSVIINGSWIVQANGTDYFEVYGVHFSAGAKNVGGSVATATWFSGSML